LAIVLVEILTVDQGAPHAGDGGMFRQADLLGNKGASINYATERLERSYSTAAVLFARALGCSSFASCPTPADWLISCDLPDAFRPPALRDVPTMLPRNLRLPSVSPRPIPFAWNPPDLDELPMTRLVS